MTRWNFFLMIGKLTTHPGWTKQRKMSGGVLNGTKDVNGQGCDSATSCSKYAVATTLSYFGFMYKPLGAACAYSSRCLAKKKTAPVFAKKNQMTNWKGQCRQSEMLNDRALQLCWDSTERKQCSKISILMSCCLRQCCKTCIRHNQDNLFLEVVLLCSLHSTTGVKENAIASTQNPHCFSILMFEARKSWPRN